MARTHDPRRVLDRRGLRPPATTPALCGSHQPSPIAHFLPQAPFLSLRHAQPAPAASGGRVSSRAAAQLRRRCVLNSPKATGWTSNLNGAERQIANWAGAKGRARKWTGAESQLCSGGRARRARVGMSFRCVAGPSGPRCGARWRFAGGMLCAERGGMPRSCVQPSHKGQASRCRRKPRRRRLHTRTRSIIPRRRSMPGRHNSQTGARTSGGGSGAAGMLRPRRAEAEAPITTLR